MSYNPDFAKLTPNELIDFLRGELDGAEDDADYLLSWVYAVACMRDDARREVDTLRAKLDKVRNASRWEPIHCGSGDYVSWSDISAIIGEGEEI
jgi:hypothetical protein